MRRVGGDVDVTRTNGVIKIDITLNAFHNQGTVGAYIAVCPVIKFPLNKPLTMGCKYTYSAEFYQDKGNFNTYGENVTKNTYYNKYDGKNLKSIIGVSYQNNNTTAYGFYMWLGRSGEIYANRINYQGKKIHIEISEPYLYEGAYLNCPYRASLDSNPQIALQKNDIFYKYLNAANGNEIDECAFSYYNTTSRGLRNMWHLDSRIYVPKGVKRRHWLYFIKVENGGTHMFRGDLVAGGEDNQLEKYNTFSFIYFTRMSGTNSVVDVKKQTFNEYHGSTYCPITLNRVNHSTGYWAICLEIDTTNLTNYSYDIALSGFVQVTSGYFELTEKWEDIS